MGEVMSEKLEKNLEQTASKKMRLLKLFWSTLYLSAFTFGGGADARGTSGRIARPRSCS